MTEIFDFSESIPERSFDHQELCSVAKRDYNRAKNASLSAVPYDRNRVCLHAIDGKAGSDYINSSHVQVRAEVFALSIHP